jgi:hypothetical protein
VPENSTFIQRYGRVGLAFLHIGFNRGIRGTYGVFYVALLQAFGWSRGVTAGAAFGLDFARRVFPAGRWLAD